MYADQGLPDNGTGEGSALTGAPTHDEGILRRRPLAANFPEHLGNDNHGLEAPTPCNWRHLRARAVHICKAVDALPPQPENLNGRQELDFSSK